MPDPIPKDLVEGFHEAVWCYHEWTPSLRESEVSINRQTYSMSAVCDLIDKFEDALPEHVIKRLFHYMDATCHMRWRSTGNIRSLVSAIFVALLTQTSTIDAAGPDIVCKITFNPSEFDHQQVTLKGMVAALTKGTSRSGRKEMTFLLRSPAGCGSVIVYAQEPATLSNGDRLRVEGIFEMEHH
jgi:hypothetical protein